jgi:hypothetical protein
MTEKIWIYVLGRELSDPELKEFSQKCEAFVNSWTAHEHQLKASFEIYKKRFLIIKVDESVYNASGCSIDKQLQFVKQLEKEFSIELLNRLKVAYESNDEVKVVNASDIKDLLQKGEINENTLVFDNTITSSLQMNEWKKSLKNTWLSKYLPSYSS